MATALQLGLVPGFALQDGDLLAELISEGGGGGGGGFGLGSTTNTNFSAGTTPAPLVASVTIVTSATVTGNQVQLVDIPVCSILRIYNQTAQAVSIVVFPPDPTQQIDGAGAGNSVTLSDNAACDYLYLGNGNWISDLLGSSSN